MGLISILSTIVSKRANAKPAAMTKSTAPLGMHQGSAVVLPDIDVALAQADGSIINVPTGTQIISAVGNFSMWNLSIYRSYFGDGSSYIQTAVDQSKSIVDCRLWSSHGEILPQSIADWEFWLGSWQKDTHGKFVRDSTGVAIRAEWGLIGWPQFQVDGPPAIVYNREWNAGSDGVVPVEFTEVIVDSFGDKTFVKHEAMEYSRRLTNASDSVTEYLFATAVQDQDGGSVNIFIGIPLDHQALKVLAS